MNITIIVRADNTGLGVQSRNWVRLLKPNKVVIIDSTPFNGIEQHFEWYEDVPQKIIVQGFIQYDQFQQILNDTDVLLTFEIPYNYNLFTLARMHGIKTILQINWEFNDYLRQPQLSLPDLLVNHSYWHLDEQMARWPNISDYCPTPLWIEDFNANNAQNIAREGTMRFLHVAGRGTYEDRNGTNDLLAAVKLIPPSVPFELVIKTQTTLVEPINDPRVTIDTNSPPDEKTLFYDFDALLFPRRYAGASLPMAEALASGLPVIMTNLEPNNKILPPYWLVGARRVSSFMARTEIDVFSADTTELATRITQMALMDRQAMSAWKTEARLIANKEFEYTVVMDKWDNFMKKLGLQ